MPPRPWVAVTATEDLPVSMKPVRAALRGIAPVRPVALPYSRLGKAAETRFAGEFQGAAGMLVRAGYVTESLLDQVPDLRIVALHGAGVDQVDVDACTARGILVTNTPGANADAVTEITIGLMINLARKIPESAWLVQQERQWGDARHTGGELKGKTLGLIGLGQIGAKIVPIAKAFGMKVLAHDPGLKAAQIRDKGAKPTTFEALLDAADFVSLHAPLMPATHHMIDRRALARMKKGAFLINAARGPLVDEAALAKALNSGRLGGAALDVLEGEPPNPKSPIFTAPNILLTPHMAGSTSECLDTIAAWAGADIARFLQGKRVKHPVNKPRKRR